MTPPLKAVISVAIIWLAAVASPAGAQAPATYSARILAPAAVARDIALLRQALEQVHAGYGRYTPRRVMDNAFAKLEARARSPMTDLELYRDVALLLARIRCGHTKAEYPPDLEKWRETHATHLPITVRIFGKRLFVEKCAAGSIERGTEIVRINHISVTDIVTKLSLYAAVDGFTDFTRSALLERDGDLMGSDIDHYWPVEFGFADEWTFALKDAKNVVREVTLPPVNFAEWKALAGESTPVDFGNGTSLRMLDDNTGLITIRSFVNYRKPVDVDTVYHRIFAELRARKVPNLVIDLRENGGGSDDASWGLLRFLADAPVKPLRSIRRRTINIDPVLRGAFQTWGDPAEIFSPDETLFTKPADGWYSERNADSILQPSIDRFDGRVSALVGRHNGSGATMLLAVLRQIGRRTGKLRLVGENTGGSAEGPTGGQILFLSLPNSKIRVRIPLKRSDVNIESPLKGFGVFPDVVAIETLDDFRVGCDRALREAMRTWR